ncbi:MAG TPA: lipopolysaccharide heptosyltransferase II [Gemmatimonadaceae bacterium]|nr:lipopolysaccharide heptosyltransferase II [Gemmatimonadaceae bacterium]
MSSLVIQTSFIGDVVLTTPLIATLTESGPVDVVTTLLGAQVLANDPHVRHLSVYDKRGRDRGAAALVRLARKVKAQSPNDVAYLAQGSLRSALLARAAGYRHRIGFTTSQGRLLYTKRVAFRRDLHHAERLLRLALDDHATVEPDALRPRVYPGPEDRAAAAALIDSVPNDGRPLIALAPGSIWGTKRWPYFPDLAASLRGDYRIAVIGSADDSPLAEAVLRATRDGIDATGRLTLLGSAALIGRCRALVTNDSAPLHLASAMNTPTVAVFGPTVPAFGFGPLAEVAAVAENTALSCRPCHPHGPRECPLGHWRCMRDLTVESVRERVAAIT